MLIPFTMYSKRLTALLFLSIALLQFHANAQTVAKNYYNANAAIPDNFIVSSGVNVTVDNCTLTIVGNLQLDGNIFLRNGGQLVQQTVGPNKNTGTGFLS